jgi:hypothetical protein
MPDVIRFAQALAVIHVDRSCLRQPECRSVISTLHAGCHFYLAPTEAVDVGVAVVLMTPDDVGKAEKAADLRLRARQNVDFELGFLLARLAPIE